MEQNFKTSFSIFQIGRVDTMREYSLMTEDERKIALRFGLDDIEMLTRSVGKFMNKQTDLSEPKNLERLRIIDEVTTMMQSIID